MLKRQGLPLLIVCLLAVLAVAPTANAATTRAEYASQVNSLCESIDQEAERIGDKYLPGIDAVSSNRKKINVKKVMRLWRNLYGDLLAADQRVITGIAGISAAPGDETLVADWVASLQRGHDLAVPAIKRLLETFHFLYKVDPYGGANDLSKGEKKKLKRYVRRLNKANKPALAEIERADALALQLGATKCTDEGGTELSARAALVPAA